MKRRDASVVVVLAGVVSGERLVEDGVTTGERSGSVAVAATDAPAAVVSSSAQKRKSNDQTPLMCR